MPVLCEILRNWGPLAGRILLSLIFVISGYGKLVSFDGTAGFIAGKGLPLPHVGAAIAIAVELGAGVLIAVGWHARWAALALFVFLIPTTLIFHDFWSYDGGQAQMQRTQFLKNLCIMGGMLYVVAFGAGPKSFDAGRR